jgi:glycosyltransferase involved in cell wall biosynthesis
MDIPKIVGISTCKGRLEHVKQTSRSFLDGSDKNTSYLVVDYGCPEKTGQWIKDILSGTGRADALIMNPQTSQFHKTIALNAGARHAIGEMQAQYLLFFDADTIIHSGFIQKLIPLLSPDRFIFVDPRSDTKDLTGLIVIHQKLFRESGGFEESFRNWGAEDLEFRLRLYAKHNKLFDVVDGEFLGSIPHDNELRTQFYSEKDPKISNAKNFKRMSAMFSLYRKEDIRNWEDMKDCEQIKKLLMLEYTKSTTESPDVIGRGRRRNL